MINNSKFPRQKLSFKAKSKEWRKSHLDWADNRSSMHDGKVRRGLLHKKIAFNLVDGVVDIDDYRKFLANNGENYDYSPSKVIHYPVINNPLNVLIGEESKRRFDYKIVVSNPLAITEVEDNKKKILMQGIEQAIKDEGLSEEEFKEQVKKHADYVNYEWQDIREVRANQIVKHYIKELQMKEKWNDCFQNALISTEEIMQFDISHGEPVASVINPNKIHAYGMGYSNRFEDADIIVTEDYWSIGKILDVYFDKLKDKDISYLEEPNGRNNGLGGSGSMHNVDERSAFINKEDLDPDAITVNGYVSFMDRDGFTPGEYFDNEGNARVLRIFWKSKRKIKKVKSYDEVTGKPKYDFYPENYVIDKNKGEEEEIFWINEAWEGTKIGKDVYVDIKPREVQYNRLTNPSRCHFGIVGSVHNTNEQKGVSLVDKMKPYQYLYNYVKDKLLKTITQNLGKIAELDLAKVPEGWDVKKWLWFIKKDKIAFVDSFKEGNKGRSVGKLAGNFNTTGRSLDLDFGNYIVQLMQLLEQIKNELNEISGVSAQRQGQVSNRETVGGVERSVVQSSHITERYFMVHDDFKKRCIECLLETAKIALKDSKKSSYILDDTTRKLMEIPGDEFAEADYGIIVDNDGYSSALEQKFEQLAHAALQNQTLSFSTILSIFVDPSLSSVRRKIEKDEKEIQERQSEQAKQANETALEQTRLAQEQRVAELDHEDELNKRDNETKIIIAEIKAANDVSIAENKLQADMSKRSEDNNIKREQIASNERKSNKSSN